MKRIIKIAVMLAISIVFLILWFLPWELEIDTTLYGAQYRIGEQNYSEDVAIIVKGVYKQYLFKKDPFIGTISIDKYDFTQNELITPIYFTDSSLTYTEIQEGKTYLYTLGILTCTPDFNNILILISEPIKADSKSWSGENGLFISIPARNREEALENARFLSSKSEWISWASGSFH